MFDGSDGNGCSINISGLDFCAGLGLISVLSKHCSSMARCTCLISLSDIRAEKDQSIFSLEKWAMLMTLQNLKHSFLLKETWIFKLDIKIPEIGPKMTWTAGNFSAGAIKIKVHHQIRSLKVTLPFCHLQYCLPQCFGMTYSKIHRKETSTISVSECWKEREKMRWNRFLLWNVSLPQRVWKA